MKLKIQVQNIYFQQGVISNNPKQVKNFIEKLDQTKLWSKIFFIPDNREYYDHIRNIYYCLDKYKELFR